MSVLALVSNPNHCQSLSPSWLLIRTLPLYFRLNNAMMLSGAAADAFA
jgi:hypothetical protein